MKSSKEIHGERNEGYIKSQEVSPISEHQVRQWQERNYKQRLYPQSNRQRGAQDGNAQANTNNPGIILASRENTSPCIFQC